MLTKLLHRTVFNRWLSLRAPTYTRPEEIDWLRLKFQGSHRFSEKLQYLNRLESQGRLPSFYEEKPIGQLDDQEIFFLMNSSSPFNLIKAAQRELMAKIESTYFKCLLLKEFRWIGTVEQYTIVFRFNQEVFQMDPYEIGFCLEIISEFVSVYEEVDANNLQKTLLRYADIPEEEYHMLLISGYATNMNLDLKKFLTKQRLEKWISQNTCWDFRAIYFTYRLSERLHLPIHKQLKDKLDKHMRSAIMKLQLNYFQSNYLVFLLSYYPQYVHLLNILQFTPRAYNGYLRFYQNHPEIKITKHKIPMSVLQLADNFSIRQIFQLRILLELDSPLSLAKSLEDYFVYSLIPVNNLIRFFIELKLQQDLEIQYQIEKALTQKLKLDQFNPDILEDYSVNQIIKLISKLVKSQMGTINFWKKAVRWIDKLIQYNKEKNIIEQQIHIIINLITIISRKSLKEQTKAIIYQMAKEILSNGQADYQLFALYGFTKSLAQARIGQDQLWILIEHRLAPILQKQKRKLNLGERNKDTLLKMAINFGLMSKGSYQLWTSFNSILDNASKMVIHSKIKSNLNPANLYLKIIEES